MTEKQMRDDLLETTLMLIENLPEELAENWWGALGAWQAAARGRSARYVDDLTWEMIRRTERK